MRYLELTEFKLILRDWLQKEAVFKQLAWNAQTAKRCQTSYKGKAIIA